MAPHSEKLKLMRVVVREDFSRARCDTLISDIKLSLDSLKDMDAKDIEQHMKRIKHHGTATGKKVRNHPHYSNEKHSLQGKSGKTHAVC